MGIIFINSFPLTNEKKLNSTVESLLTYGLTVKHYPQKHYGYRILFPEYSLPMLHSIVSIIENQIKVYRKILFPNEFRKLYHYCPICQTRRFYSRMDYIAYSSKPNSQNSLNNMFKCNSCHYVEYEHKLSDKVQTPQRWAMNMPKGFMDKESAWFDVYEKIWHYEKMNIPFENFFIKLNKKLVCPVCDKVFSKRSAKQHYSGINNKDTPPPCRNYVKF